MVPSRRPAFVAGAVVLAFAAVACPAGAQPSAPGGGKTDAAKLEAAKKDAAGFANRAFEDFTQGKYEAAVIGFELADKAFHSPKFLLYMARAYVKLGRLRAGKGVYHYCCKLRLPRCARAAARRAVVLVLPTPGTSPGPRGATRAASPTAGDSTNLQQ
jgi:hypothetical protein